MRSFLLLWVKSVGLLARLLLYTTIKHFFQREDKEICLCGRFLCLCGFKEEDGTGLYFLRKGVLWICGIIELHVSVKNR